MLDMKVAMKGFFRYETYAFGIYSRMDRGQISAIVKLAEHSHLFLCKLDAKKGMAIVGKINVALLEENFFEDEPMVYIIKLKAKDVFKEKA